MAKDFVVASNKKEAIYSKSVDLTIEDNIFEIIQGSLLSKRENLPMLWSLFKDQYGDSVIGTSRLKKLREEIVAFLEGKTITLEGVKVFGKLKIICSKCIKEKKRLYSFGD